MTCNWASSSQTERSLARLFVRVTAVDRRPCSKVQRPGTAQLR